MLFLASLMLFDHISDNARKPFLHLIWFRHCIFVGVHPVVSDIERRVDFIL